MTTTDVEPQPEPRSLIVPTPQPWLEVCRFDALRVERGSAALVHGEQIALFRLVDGTVAAVDHLDPYSGAHVIARGIVGSTGDRTTVASPMHKQVFDLATGECLSEAGAGLRTWPVRVVDGYVQVAVPPSRTGAP
jgi:nitrite reductase (NADH) small subunit